jgi:hypothetical protein
MAPTVLSLCIEGRTGTYSGIILLRNITSYREVPPKHNMEREKSAEILRQRHSHGMPFFAAMVMVWRENYDLSIGLKGFSM